MRAIDQDPGPWIQDARDERDAHEPTVESPRGSPLPSCGCWQHPNHGYENPEREAEAKDPESPAGGRGDEGAREEAEDHHGVAEEHEGPRAHPDARDEEEVEEEERRCKELHQVVRKEDWVCLLRGVLFRKCRVPHVERGESEVPVPLAVLCAESPEHKDAIACRHGQVRHAGDGRAEEGVEVEEALGRLCSDAPDEEEDREEKHNDKLEVEQKYPKRREAGNVQDIVDAERFDPLHQGFL